ncbi:MAG: O-antigen ligase family protein [Thermoleophilia bacterium]
MLGAVALAGWAALSCGGGGIDPGDGLGGAGPTAAFLALALGAPLAAAVLIAAWREGALRSAPALVALGATAGLAVWSALSIAWAAAPDLAWIDANRGLTYLAALILGLALGALVPRAPIGLGIGLALAAMPAILLALAHKVLPGRLGSDADPARLADPLGYWNALALVAVFALPGLLWAAGAPRRRAWAAALAGAGVCLVVVTLMLTYSRGGLMAAVMAVAITVAFLPRRVAALSALAAGVVGAALPSAFALTDTALSTDAVPTDLREGPGAGLGWRLAVGVALAAALAPGLAWTWRRLGLGGARTRRAALVGGLVLLVAAVGVLSGTATGRGWTGDRVAEFRGEGGDAVANTPGRLVNTAGNQRKAWWGEAWRGFEDSPAVGQGAGGFPLVHLRYRLSGDDALNTREPHGVVLRMLSGLGIVGLALFAALVAAVVWGVLRSAGRDAGPEIGLPIAVLGAFALQAAVDWSWAVPALTTAALAAAGVVLSAAGPRPERRRARPGGLAIGLITAVTLLAVGSATLPWWSAHEVRAGQRALTADDPAAALDLAGRARTANPLSLEPLTLRGMALTSEGDLGRALASYLAATRLQPDNPVAWRYLADFYGDDPRAAQAWRRVHELDPQDPDAALRAAQ